MARSPATLSIEGKDYVVLPKAEYLRLVGRNESAKLEDARSALREVYGDRLRRARERAGLTQAQLAARLHVTQPMVSSTEAGRARVSARYLARVLKACGLAKDWVPERPAKGPASLAR
jgi:ribosome-binding protein aMBF1 (putative translation factor)